MNKKLLVTLSAIGCMSVAIGVGCTSASSTTKEPNAQESQVEESDDDTEDGKECKIEKTKDYELSEYIKDGDYASKKIKDIVLPKLIK